MVRFTGKPGLLPAVLTIALCRAGRKGCAQITARGGAKGATVLAGVSIRVVVAGGFIAAFGLSDPTVASFPA